MCSKHSKPCIKITFSLGTRGLTKQPNGRRPKRLCRAGETCACPGGRPEPNCATGEQQRLHAAWHGCGRHRCFPADTQQSARLQVAAQISDSCCSSLAVAAPPAASLNNGSRPLLKRPTAAPLQRWQHHRQLSLSSSSSRSGERRLPDTSTPEVAAGCSDERQLLHAGGCRRHRRFQRGAKGGGAVGLGLRLLGRRLQCCLQGTRNDQQGRQ